MKVRSVVFGLLLCSVGSLFADDWPEFRGPDRQGRSSATGLPLTWSETENVAWKVPVPGLGWSSPSIVGRQIWMTTATEEGRSLRAVCLDRDTGSLIHDIELFHHDDPGKIHQKNSYASPTPLIEDGRVFVHFGSLGTAAVSTDGKILWRTRFEYYHRHGPSGSPVLYGDLLIINCDGYDHQFIVAIQKETGKEVWRANRQARHSYATPLIITVDGQDQIISTTADRTIAYDPLTGKEIWWIEYDGYSLVPRPVYGNGLVIICSGYNTPLVYAVRPTGRGNVTETHVAWSLRRGAPHTPSPLMVGEELYLVTDRGVASCVNVLTGDVHWQKRLGGDFSASPTFADGRIYFQSETGTTTVVAPGVKYEELARNQLDGRTFASYAIVDNAIFLRSDSHLYRLQLPTK